MVLSPRQHCPHITCTRPPTNVVILKQVNGKFTDAQSRAQVYQCVQGLEASLNVPGFYIPRGACGFHRNARPTDVEEALDFTEALATLPMGLPGRPLSFKNYAKMQFLVQFPRAKLHEILATHKATVFFHVEAITKTAINGGSLVCATALVKASNNVKERKPLPCGFRRNFIQPSMGECSKRTILTAVK